MEKIFDAYLAGMKLIPAAIGAFFASFVSLLMLSFPFALVGYTPSDFAMGAIWATLFVLWFLFWNSKKTRKALMEGWAFCDRH